MYADNIEETIEGKFWKRHVYSTDRLFDVPPPEEGLEECGSQGPLLQLGHEDVGIGGGHPGAHGRKRRGY